MQQIMAFGIFVFKEPAVKDVLVIPGVVSYKKKQNMLFRIRCENPPTPFPVKGDYINVFGRIQKISIENDNVVIDMVGEFEKTYSPETPLIMCGLQQKIAQLPEKTGNGKYVVPINKKFYLFFSEKQIESLDLKEGENVSIVGDFWVSIKDNAVIATLFVKSCTKLNLCQPKLQEITATEEDLKKPMF